ncbi:phage baseplate protein [Corallococcus exercitus]|uniref:GPW/gp25 family protein n=1 Tax=Corallococcus exercitus TaxID=2316736 RepID=UPI000EA2636E|nr:GPW/gp25 family protein [Corallococcus exercitus]RKG82613.1 phage baseplate protein [Corallococcus exercitus]
MSEPFDQRQRLGDPPCLAFPFRVEAQGPAISRRGQHVREQIEQVLFTTPGERVFRPDFGGGAKMLVFEPNGTPLWEVTRRRMQAALADALRGEVDPGSLELEVTGEDEKLQLVVRYRLTTLGVPQQQLFAVGGVGG